MIQITKKIFTFVKKSVQYLNQEEKTLQARLQVEVGCIMLRGKK